MLCLANQSVYLDWILLGGFVFWFTFFYPEHIIIWTATHKMTNPYQWFHLPSEDGGPVFSGVVSLSSPSSLAGAHNTWRQLILFPSFLGFPSS